MEEEVITVKQEPLDSDHEYELEADTMMIAAATSPIPAAAIKVEDELIIKTECENDDNFPKTDATHIEIENMNVVEERANIITVNAVDLKSEDERSFIKSMDHKNISSRLRKNRHYQQTCAKCLQTFHMRRSYEQHIDFGLCTILENNQKCAVCPMSFGTQAQLDAHLELHKLNRFFCSKHCGNCFDAMEECELHEYRVHQVRTILCSICNHKFPSCDALSQHMQSHSSLKRFFCSFCREWFSCSIDLTKHWQVNVLGCGQLMQDIVRDTMDAIELALPVFNVTMSKGKQQNENKRKIGTAGKKTNNVAVEPTSKRSKVASKDVHKELTQDNSKPPSYISLDDIQIKEEPREDENSDDLQSLVTNAGTSSESDLNFAIKTEPEEFNPDTSLKSNVIPAASTSVKAIAPVNAPTNNAQPAIPKLKLVRLPSLQSPPTSQIPSLKPLQLQNQNIKTAPINLTGYKIFKLMPNSKLLRLPVKNDPTTNDHDSSTTVDHCNQNHITNPIVLKLKSPPSNYKTSTLTKSTSAQSAQSAQSAPTQVFLKTQTEPAIIVTLNSLATNTTIDAEDLKKLVNEAAVAAKSSSEVTSRKIMCKSRNELKLIESLPQKREIIDNLKEQIKKFDAMNGLEMPSLLSRNNDVESLQSGDIKCEASFESTENNEAEKTTRTLHDEEHFYDDGFGDEDDDDDDYDSKSLVIDEDNSENNSANSSSLADHSNPTAIAFTPPSFFLPISTDCDPELSLTKKKYKEYRYAWMCPKCPRYYAQKYAFRGHLVCAHSFAKEDFNNLIIEVKAHKIAKSCEELKAGKRKQKHSESETESTVTNTNDSATASNVNGSNEEQGLHDKRRKDTSKFTCVDCGRACSTRTQLNDHVQGNCGRDPQYPCPTCPKKFYSASTLNSHMSIHTGVLPHKCDYCEKRFRTRGQVTVHHRTHTGERPFVCQVCAQKFTHRETLISHLSRHIGMKRYKCYSCNQQFSCISGLKTHREVRFDSCGKVKLNTRAIGPRVRVIKGNVIFEAQPEINPYLRTEDPDEVLAEINQNKNL